MQSHSAGLGAAQQRVSIACEDGGDAEPGSLSSASAQCLFLAVLEFRTGELLVGDRLLRGSDDDESISSGTFLDREVARVDFLGCEPSFVLSLSRGQSTCCGWLRVQLCSDTILAVDAKSGTVRDRLYPPCACRYQSL